MFSFRKEWVCLKISSSYLSVRKLVVLNFRQNDDQIENLIPVLMLQHPLNCNEAMQKGYSLLIEEAEGFCDAENRLRDQTDGQARHVTECFIQGCLNIAMGLAHWR